MFYKFFGSLVLISVIFFNFSGCDKLIYNKKIFKQDNIETNINNNIDNSNLNKIKDFKFLEANDKGMILDKNSSVLETFLNLDDSEALELSRKFMQYGINGFFNIENLVYSDVGDIYFDLVTNNKNYKVRMKQKNDKLEIITISDDKGYLYDSL